MADMTLEQVANELRITARHGASLEPQTCHYLANAIDAVIKQAIVKGMFARLQAHAADAAHTRIPDLTDDEWMILFHERPDLKDRLNAIFDKAAYLSRYRSQCKTSTEAAQAQAQSGEWVMVPREPTKAMIDLDTLRPEVREDVEYLDAGGTARVAQGSWTRVRAELLRQAREIADLRDAIVGLGAMRKAVEAELAALKARISGSVELTVGEPAWHDGTLSELKGKRVHLVVEE